MSDDVSNKEELKDLLGVQSNKPRRHIAQPHESSLGKGLSAELHSWIRFCMGGWKVFGTTLELPNSYKFFGRVNVLQQ